MTTHPSIRLVLQLPCCKAGIRAELDFEQWPQRELLPPRIDILVLIRPCIAECDESQPPVSEPLVDVWPGADCS